MVETNGVQKWTDRDRVLGLCSRGSLVRTRHILNDLCHLMPHMRREAKFEKGEKLDGLNEIAELANCTKCIYFENRKHRDLYLWMAEVEHAGPSVQFLVHNMHTMYELKFSGNCLKGSRPVLSFDSKFDSLPHYKIIKELLTGVFKTPNYHPKSQPFIDHILNFAITTDGNIWMRNYQIVDDTGKLEEIGPRMVWETIRVFDGSFSGKVLYQNPNFKTPNTVRHELKLEKAAQIINRQEQKDEAVVKEAFVKSVLIEDPVGDVFDTDKLEEAKSKDPIANELDRAILKKRKRKRNAKNSSATDNLEEEAAATDNLEEAKAKEPVADELDIFISKKQAAAANEKLKEASRATNNLEEVKSKDPVTNELEISISKKRKLKKNAKKQAASTATDKLKEVAPATDKLENAKCEVLVAKESEISISKKRKQKKNAKKEAAAPTNKLKEAASATDKLKESTSEVPVAKESEISISKKRKLKKNVKKEAAAKKAKT